jgi:hypothetical protein
VRPLTVRRSVGNGFNVRPTLDHRLGPLDMDAVRSLLAYLAARLSDYNNQIIFAELKEREALETIGASASQAKTVPPPSSCEPQVPFNSAA